MPCASGGKMRETQARVIQNKLKPPAAAFSRQWINGSLSAQNFKRFFNPLVGIANVGRNAR